jgi:SAM-dependent methyltransferase
MQRVGLKSFEVRTPNKDLKNALGKPEATTEVQTKILIGKPILLNWYRKIYDYMAGHLAPHTVTVELGSGSSLLYEHIPGLIKSNIIPVQENDLTFSAYQMPFENGSVGNLILINVLHHLGDPYAFFEEAERVLKPGGRVLISDPYLSCLSFPVWNFLHPEPCNIKKIGFEGVVVANPLTDANSATATLLFASGRDPFRERCRGLSVVEMKLHTKFQYWLAGGYNFPQLFPTAGLPVLDFFEHLFAPFDKWLASFMFAIIEKKGCR